jgi:hypothetical protein
VQLAAEMVTVLASAFHGGPLVIEGTTWTTRLPSSAVLSGPKPPPTGKRGRLRKKGNRIGTCADAARAADWTDTTVQIYGKEQNAQVTVQDALWYGSFKDAPGQLVHSKRRTRAGERWALRVGGPIQPLRLEGYLKDMEPPVPRRAA